MAFKELKGIIQKNYTVEGQDLHLQPANQMKIYIPNPERFFPETIEFYKSFAELTDADQADLVVINDFELIESTKPVACNSTGLDHIKAPEIISLRGEDLSDFTAVPELCLGMMIHLSRTIKKEEVRGKKLAILGYGRIGKKFAEYAKAIGMEVWAYDTAVGTMDIALTDLLPMADVVSIHITSDEENRGYFNSEKFGKMKDGAILLNSSRPWLVDYPALKLALNNKLSVAWFDFEMPFKHSRLVTTNHLGGTTPESKKKSELLLAQKIKRIYAN